MLTRVALILGILLVACYGVAEGLWSERWITTPQLREAPDKFAQIPQTIGPWIGEDRELDERSTRLAELKASLVRNYTNSDTGATVSVLLVAGRSGPICVHSPEVCLGGSGFNLTASAARKKIEAGGITANFWQGLFRKATATLPEEVELYWAWNPGNGWRAAASPRFEFLRERALFKLYVSRRVSSSDTGPSEDSPIPGFLQRFLPEIQPILFPAP